MVTATQTRPQLSDEQLRDLLELLKGVDTVELKLTVPETYHRSAVRALEMDPLDVQIRQVVFFDTPDLTLNKAGVVVRARRVQTKGDDTVVKLRPVDPSQMPPEIRKSPSFGIEVDVMPGGFVCSGSFKGVLPAGTVKQAIEGRLPIRKLFTKEQRAFYAEHAPTGLTMDSLTVLGPITVMKLKYLPRGFDRKLVAELWFYPDGSRILELSTKCMPREAFQVSAEARAFLSSRGIDLSGAQQTKTATALKFFTNPTEEPEAASA
jgi:hypothetical protein